MAEIVSDSELEALLGPDSVSYTRLDDLVARLPSHLRENARNSLSSKGFFYSEYRSNQSLSDIIHDLPHKDVPEGPNIDELFLDITYDSDGASDRILLMGTSPSALNTPSILPHPTSPAEVVHQDGPLDNDSSSTTRYREIQENRDVNDPNIRRNNHIPSRISQIASPDDHSSAPSDLLSTQNRLDLPTNINNCIQNEPINCIQNCQNAPKGSNDSNDHGLVDVNNPQEEEENAHHLKTYLGGVSHVTRRGLRHRTFTNAHPYLADSAQWMGLASTEVLNQMFDQNQDVELIVKALNTQYIKKKKRYPKDYKFRSKNFYAFLGNVRKSQLSAQNEEAFMASQDASSANHSSQVRSSRSLQVDDDFSGHEDELAEAEDEFNGLNGSESLADELKGLNDTYETVNSLEFYKERHGNQDQALEVDISPLDRPRRFKKHKPSVIDLRKDQQRREKTQLRPSTPRDISSYWDEEQHSEGYNQQPNQILELQLHFNLFDEHYQEPQVSYSNSDRSFARAQFQDDTQYFESPEPRENSERIQNKRAIVVEEDYVDEVDPPTWGEVFDRLLDTEDAQTQTLPNDYFDFEVQEMDRVDPMFAYSRAPKANSKTGVTSKRVAATGLQRSLLQSRILERGDRRSRIVSINRTQSLGVKGGQKLKSNRTILKNCTPNTDRSLSQHRVYVKNKRKRVSPELTSRQKFLKVTPMTLESSNRPSNNQIKSSDSKRIPLAPINSNTLQPRTKSVKEIMNDAYLFSRKPVSSTTVIESESLRKFIAPDTYRLAVNDVDNGYGVPGELQFKEMNDMIFPDSYIFSKFQGQKIHLLRLGYTKITDKDAVYCVLLGESYSLLLLNKSTSRRTFSKLLHHLHRIFIESPTYLKTPSVEAEIYRAISTAIEWVLIVQENQEETSWRILHSLLTNFDENLSHLKIKIMYVPYFLLLWFILKQVLERSSVREDTDLSRVKHSNKFMTMVASKYFEVLFQNFSADELKHKLAPKAKLLTFQHESLYAIYFIFFNDSTNNWWWKPIEEAVVLIANTITFEPSDTLDQLLLIASMVPVKRAAWNPFYALYRFIGTDPTSYIHEKFLKIVLHLKDRFLWTIQEKMITTVYNGIATRKFADFRNEATDATSGFFSSELLGRLTSRDSIPNSTFFGKFMFLLFSYVSDLPIGANKKRLISKLLPSSHFTYGQDSKSFGMFINRTNFVLLLLHISNLDLKGQFDDLMKAVSTNTNDFQFLHSACRACDLYCEIAIEKQLSVPTKSYSDLMSRTALLYDVSKHQQFLELWSEFEYQIVRKFLGKDCSSKYVASALEIIQNIDTQVLNEKLIAGYLKLIMRSLKSNSTAPDSLALITEKVVSTIQIRMGKLPQLKIEDEAKIDLIVELGLRGLIMCYNSCPTSSWNELIFQKYPYLGNLYLRNKYAIFFYSELLEFLNISEHLDTYVVAFLLILTPGNQSKYQTTFLNRLRSLNEPVFHFKNKLSLPDFISKLHFNMIRPTVAAIFIENLISTPTFSEKTKEYFMREYVTILSRCIQDLNLAKDAYKKYVAIIEKWGLKYVKDFPAFRSLTRNLGLQHFEVDRIAWSQLSLQERLRIIHGDILAGLRLKQDCFKVLDKYVTVDEFELIYHLISLYLKSIVTLQHEKWILVFIVFEYLNSKLNGCAVNLTDGSLKALLSLLTELGSLKNFSSRSGYFMFELLSFESALRLFSTAFKIHNGYKDTSQMVGNIEMFIKNFRNANSASSDGKLLNNPFSSLRLYDIHIVVNEIANMGNNINIQLGDSIIAMINTNKQDIDNANAYHLHRLDQCIQNLHELTGAKDNSCTLEFDL